MPSYFRQVPDFDYVSRDSNQRQISEYATVKNLFRRGKLRDDIFGNLSFFTKYQIIGDERPDNVAYKIYNDETLDWVILLSNNILNIQTEWPLPQSVFDEVMLEKYGSYEELYNGIHHYETKEIRDSAGNLIFSPGIQMPSTWKSGNGLVQSFKSEVQILSYELATKKVSILLNESIQNLNEGSVITISNSKNSAFNGTFTVAGIDAIDSSTNEVLGFNFNLNVNTTENIVLINGGEIVEFISTAPMKLSTSYYYQYYDINLDSIVRIPSSSFLTPVTNYEYESKLEDDKRNIFVLKPGYLNVMFNDLEEIMKYKKGSTQYVSRTLKRGDNIRIYS
jgi:hypothetical protein